MRRIKYLFGLLWLVRLTAQGFPSDSIKSVLYVNSYHQGHVWADSLLKGIQSILTRSNGVELYIENFDSQRFPDSLYAEKFTDYLVNKYIKTVPDLYLASDDGAARLLLNFRARIGSQKPCVLCGINDREYYAGFGNVYGVLETFPIDSTLGPLLRRFPDVQRVWVVSDSTPSSLQIRKEIARQAVAFGGKPEMRFLPLFDPDGIISAVETLEKGEAVFVINMRMYKGRTIDFPSFLKSLTGSCPVPVFCNSTEAPGTGTIGSRITRGYTHGRDAAILAITLLKNPELRPTPPWREPHMEYVFDYRSVSKFGYNVKNLPSGSVILNQPHTLWTRYKKAILVGGAVTLFLLGVILILSFNISRRIKAEKIIREQMAEIERKSNSLEEALSALQLSHKQLETANEQLTELTLSLEEARERAEESDHLKSAFLANISHEIRTPLNAILGFSSLLLKENRNDPHNFSYLTIIRKAGDNLLSLIDKIILVAKIETNQVEIFPQSFHVATLFRQLAAEIRNKFSEKEMQLIFVPPEEQQDGLMIHTDRELLRIILTELLENACRFSEGIQVRCTASLQSDKMILFQIEDNGVGISTEKQKFLFNRFYKMESNDRFHQGLGLGLFIVKSLVELLRGKISFQSEQGRGTVFQFTIPSGEM